MKFNQEYKSRFRILKGGKISLVVSALLVGTTFNVAQAADISVTTGTTAQEIPITVEASTVTLDGSLEVASHVTALNILTNQDTALSISNGSVLSATASVTNSSIDNYALNMYIVGSTTSSITNSGTISSSMQANDSGYAYAHGINIDNELSSNSSITNSGTISATATTTGVGEYAKAFGIKTEYVHGDITNASGGSITASSTGDAGTAIGIDVGYLLDGTIANAGTISATATSGSASAILQSIGDQTSSGTITNSGTISATSTDGTADTISFSYYFNGTVQNDAGGTISATSTNDNANALNFNHYFDSNALISNAGTISATAASYARAINFESQFDGTITNTGTLSSTLTGNTTSYTVDFQGPMQGSLTNSGTISASSSHNTGGLYAVHTYNDMYGTITNEASGTISATAIDSYAVAVGFAEGMEDGSALTNSGTIEASTTGSGIAYGIYSGANIDGTITNNSGATISATSVSDTAHGIYINANLNSSGSISNAGTISVTSTSGDANGIFVDGATSGDITNSGTISATSTDGDATALNFGLNDITGSIVNDGTISANSTNGTATALRARYIYTNGSFTNNGTLAAYKNGELDASAYAIKLNGNFENLENTGDIYGNIGIGNSGNVNSMLTNSGTISLPYNANGLNSATIENFTQTAAGTLQIGLFTSDDGDVTSKYSTLSTTNATFADGSTIDVDVKTASNNQSLLVGETLSDVVVASTSLTLDGTLNITDNSALLNFEYVEDGETIDLTIVEGQSAAGAVTAAGGNSSTRAAATILTNGNFSAVETQLNALTTDKAVEKAVKSTTPMAATATSGASTQVSNGIRSIVQTRQNTLSGLNSGDALLSDKNFWFKPYVSIGSQNNKDGINGFGLRTGGFGVGIDGEYASNQRIGMALFFTQAEVEVNDVTQTSDLDIFSVLVYGSSPLIDARTSLQYQVAYARQETSSKRTLFNGDIATADYVTNSASLDLKLMREYKLSDSFMMQPMLEATYRYSDNPAYTETGAGTLNLSVNAFNTNEITAGVGTLANYRIDEKKNLFGNLNLGYDVKQDGQTVTSAYAGSAGATFDTNGIDNGKMNYEAGVGLGIKDILDGELSVMYNYQAQGSDFQNNIVSAKYLLKF